MDFYSLQTRSLEGEPVELSDYRGKVSLVVNVASQCGYTPQYTGLQELQQRFEPEGFVVLGFPSNDFGGQEPGTPEEIRAFCSERYHVAFPMFEKVQTRRGEGQSQIYGVLGEMAGELPRWNFGKYLVGRDGKVIAYFGSNVTPESGELRGAIEKALLAEG
jgi:glutathione peroxidase